MELRVEELLEGTLLSKTLSFCPTCLKVIEADLIETKDGVYLVKEHCGRRIVYKLENDAEFYREFRLNFEDFVSQKLEIGETVLDAWRKKLNTMPCPQVYITSKCNMKCKVCFIRDALKERDMKPEELGELLEIYKGKTITLTGGEPTIHPQFFEILDIIRKKGKRAWVLTNGTMLDEESFVRKMKEKKVYRVCLSFDGWKPEIYEKWRGVNGEEWLKRKEKAIELLRKYDVPTNIFMVVSKENIDELPKVIDFIIRDENKFIKDLWAISLYPSDTRPSDVVEKVSKTYNIPKEYFYELKRLKWNAFKVYYRLKPNKKEVDTDMLYDIIFFKIEDGTIKPLFPLEEVKRMNRKIEKILNMPIGKFLLHLPLLLPELIRYIRAKLNHYRRKDLALTLSRILTPENIDLNRDFNLGLDLLFYLYLKKPEELERLDEPLPGVPMCAIKGI